MDFAKVSEGYSVYSFLVPWACSETENSSGNGKPATKRFPFAELTANQHRGRLPLPLLMRSGNFPKNGGGKEFNRLVFESSPYLLQHAPQPNRLVPLGRRGFRPWPRKRTNRSFFPSDTPPVIGVMSWNANPSRMRRSPNS